MDSPISKDELDEALKRYPYLTRDAAFYALADDAEVAASAARAVAQANDRYVRLGSMVALSGGVSRFFEVRL